MVGRVLLFALAVAHPVLPQAADASRPLSLLGTWRVTAVAAYSAVSALSEEEAHSWIDAIVVYDNDIVRSQNGFLSDPIYEFRWLSDREILEYWRVSPADMGIPHGGAFAVAVTPCTGESSTLFGSNLLIDGEDRIFAAYEGVWYEMRRDR